MKNRFQYAGVALLAAGAIAGQPALAQKYPTHPIRIMVGYAPGGGTDIMARTVSAKLVESLGQQVIVENHPGANANIAAQLVAEAPPDGYTVLFMSVSHIMSKPVYKHLKYDIETDLAPITVVSRVPNVLGVHPSVPVRTVKEYIALAKSKPGELTYGTSGVGSPEHFAGEMFKMMTGTNVLAIPYKGGGPIAIALVSGQIVSSFSTMPPIIPHVRSGRVRALAVTTGKRAEVLPDVPTVAEAGVPGYEMSTWYGVMVPAGTPQSIINLLSRDTLKALAMPDVKKRLSSLGAEIVGTTPKETAAFFKSELAKFTKVAHEANIHID